MNVSGIEHVEFYVDDAGRAAADLGARYGFTIDEVGKGDDSGAGTRFREGGGSHADTGSRSDAAYSAQTHTVAVRQGRIKLLLTSATDPDHPARRYVERHGDGVAVIALGCRDPRAAFANALEAGAQPLRYPVPTIAGFGDVALRFVDAGIASVGATADASAPLLEIDHVALCVPARELKQAVRFSEAALGFREIFREYVRIGSQGMDSVVVQSESGAVTFTLLEPDTTRRPGQIDAFLDAHGGAGVQHLAFRTDDIAAAISKLTGRGVSFLTTPSQYYDVLSARVGDPAIALDTLRHLNVLVDRDHGGQLFQIFTRSAHPRGTLFFELIERRGACTFGTANIRALYEAVERQQSAEYV